MDLDPIDDLLRRQQGVATRSQLAAAGLTRRGLERAVRDGALRRERPGLYTSPDRPARGAHLVSGGQVALGFLGDLRTLLLAVGGDAAAARRSAAVLWGFDLAVEPTLLDIDVPRSRARAGRGGADVRRRRLDDVVEHSIAGADPVRLTSPLRTVVDCAADRPLDEAVVIADSALRSGRVTVEDLRRASAVRTSRATAEQVRRVLRWADPQSGSVLESLLRVLLARHGILVPQTQFVVKDDQDCFVGRVDFCWPELRLIVEADGRRWHDPEDARDRDRRRGNQYAALGWVVLRFTWGEVVHAPDDVVATVSASLASQRRLLAATA